MSSTDASVHECREKGNVLISGQFLEKHLFSSLSCVARNLCHRLETCSNRCLSHVKDLNPSRVDSPISRSPVEVAPGCLAPSEGRVLLHVADGVLMLLLRARLRPIAVPPRAHPLAWRQVVLNSEFFSKSIRGIVEEPAEVLDRELGPVPI
jgi:hypothetical protein